MAPRGGKRSRTKKCATASITRLPKRRRDIDASPVIERRTIPSSSSHPRPSLTPTNPSRSHGSTPHVRTGSSSFSSRHRCTAPVPMEYTNESDADYEVDTVAADEVIRSDHSSDSTGEDSSDSSSGEEEEEDNVAPELSINEEDNVDVAGSCGTIKRRGPNKSKKPSKSGERRLIAKAYKGKLTGIGVPSYFTTQISRRVYAFWPKYKYIDQIVKDRIWESFLAVYEIVGEPVEFARFLFEDDSRRKWRNLLTRTRRTALNKLNVDDPALLLGTQPPLWLNDPAVWEQYVQHWCKAEQRALGIQARKNRLSSKRPDGKPSTHSLGSKGLRERMLEVEERTGKPASALPILLDLNQKKDKATAEPTGEMYNQNFKDAYDEYVVLFAEKYGPDADPTAFWDKKLWKQTGPVRAGLSKGRVLGAGYTANAEMLMDDGAGTSQSAPPPSSVIHDLEVKNSELEHELQEVKTSNTELKEEVAGLRGDVNRLTNLMQAYMAGSAAGVASGVRFTMPPVATTGTATDLLVSMHQGPPPTAAATTDVQPPPPTEPTQHDS